MKHVLVQDSLNKQWDCNVTLDNGTLILQPYGYDRSWPLHLDKDTTFLSNAKDAYVQLGMTHQVKLYKSKSEKTIIFIGDGVNDLT